MSSEDTGGVATFAARCSFAAKLPPQEARLYWQLCRYQDIRDGAMRDADWQTALQAHEKTVELERALAGVLDVE